VKLTTHLHLVPRLKIRGAIPPLTAWCFFKNRMCHDVVFSYPEGQPSTVAAFTFMGSLLFYVPCTECARAPDGF
jgi:hypothetical protein